MDFSLPTTKRNGRSRCPLCSSATLIPFLHRDGVPVLTNLLFETQEAARQIPRGTMVLVTCGNCGFVFNRAYEDAALYTPRYDNSQAYATSFEAYLDDRVHSLVTEHHIQQCHIIEVGCGDGRFLQKLVEAGQGNTGSGFDPSYCGSAYALDGRLQFAARYYDETCSDESADVLVCRHVIEHIPAPLSFLRMLHHAFSTSPKRAFFETPDIEWVLRKRVMWDVYYEHCSYFSAETIAYALKLSGFNVERIQRTFGEQYLWVEATVGKKDAFPVIKMAEPEIVSSLASQFQRDEQRSLETWKQIIQRLVHDGPIALLGAAGKGVTLANLIDPDCQLISCLVDLNPHKQQKFLPGTGHPIVSYEGMKAYKITTAILLNPNYYDETLQLLQDHQIQAKIVSDSAASLELASERYQGATILEQLAARVELARQQGRTIVFTNGVFDLLHAGHVQFLRYAKTLGDVLIVAVDSDASVRRLKGPGRPIHHERDRLMMVAALEMVDETLLFESEALPDLIRTLRPQRYVKGGEYRGKSSPVQTVLQAIGGQSMIAPLFSNDLHTSQIVERILALAPGQ